jgi:hypothetical protein
VAFEVMEQDGDIYALTRPYDFRSPPIASAALVARTSNGRVDCHDE